MKSLELRYYYFPCSDGVCICERGLKAAYPYGKNNHWVYRLETRKGSIDATQTRYPDRNNNNCFFQDIPLLVNHLKIYIYMDKKTDHINLLII